MATEDDPAPGILFPGISDDHARSLLEDLLLDRHEGAASPDDSRLALSAVANLANLVAGVGAWAIARMAPRDVPFDQFGKLPAERRRSIIARSLRLMPLMPLMQPGATAELAEALVALNGGQTNALLSPTKTGRRGARPYTKATLELQALSWIRWRKGCGFTVEKSEALLADAICRSTDVFRQWQGELRKLFGGELVLHELGDAERAGHICSSPPCSPPRPAPDGLLSSALS
jgi:hypothetical protein